MQPELAAAAQATRRAEPIRATLQALLQRFPPPPRTFMQRSSTEKGFPTHRDQSSTSMATTSSTPLERRAEQYRDGAENQQKCVFTQEAPERSQCFPFRTSRRDSPCPLSR